MEDDASVLTGDTPVERLPRSKNIAPEPFRSLIHCPFGCLTPKHQNPMKFHSLTALAKHMTREHPDTGMSLTFAQPVEINQQAVEVQRRVLAFDEPLELENGDGDEMSVNSGGSGVHVLLIGDSTMQEVGIDDLNFAFGQMLLLEDAGDSEDEKDA